VVYARLFDPRTQELQGLTIMEMKDGRFWQLFSAERGTWRGTTWELRNVKHTTTAADGSQMSQMIARMTHDIGKSPTELRKIKKDLVDMSMAELKAELAQRIRLRLPYRPDISQVLQTIQVRWAAPWVTVGFALIGAPLGLRPTRATTGIGLGLSLMIVFSYYVIFNTLVIIGNQGGLPPLLAAWTPNLIVYAAGLGLYVNAAR
jgi:lipopolysaccharide export system permease protein